ncbi:hypothetical protein CEP51_014041 [Fusarium floridanum]|uniref:AAA+ ATPase domain-containing protein n=1 Tax=Fusarium floridanum TaxID=1325733 RepID=A0A428Q046_9HYPO|nr:hypothetical protein CEP51_014041 [Fusarium floridanum]
MTLLSNLSPPLIQKALSQQMSVLDLFLPGFTNITSAASQILSGNLTGYTHLMCILALAAFLKPYIFELRDWFIEHCIILDEKQKGSLIRELRDFLDPETRRWYSEHSMSYKQGYLLHGPPGTGKSSFSLSIAGELGMDIYVVSIPSTNDQMLKGLFAGLPDRCVVLLEDIDAAGATCSRDSGPEDSDSDTDSRSRRRGVTLSGLLNVLDGVASQEDRVLIMTTNHPKKLDEALTRPGRVDFKVEFQLADRGIAREIYRFMFGQLGRDVTEHGQPEGCDGEVERQAKEFAAMVPESEFSPAEIMSYLLRHRRCPAAAIKNCGQWADNLLREKKAKKIALKDGRKNQRG